MEGENVLAFLATDEAGNTVVDTVLVTRNGGGGGGGLPPAPEAVAPSLTQNLASTLGSATSFLYEGSDSIQTGVAPGTIDPVRVAVLRGRVLDRAGSPVTGAQVTILGHPEFGQTLTRSDGRYDMAVNGGGFLNVRVEKSGYPEVQRRSELPTQDYYVLDDIVMTPLDTAVTVVDFSDPIEIAQGTLQSDTSGTRQATLMFKQGTTASMVFANDSVAALSSVSVRATEYTVGEDGPEAMPAELPRTSGYTYAAEFSVDEAIAAGAERVEFSQPVAVYVENFLGFPVGEAVPSGYFDRTQGEWLPQPNGRVIRVVDIQSGVAELDIDGDSIAEPADTVAAHLNINADELDAIGSTYSIGDELWRVEVSHFSPFDFNWPLFLDSFVDRFPENEPPEPGEDDTPDDPCEVAGSIIGCESQAVGEAVSLVGTPFALTYSSLRVPGRSSAYTLDIPLTQDTVPTGLTHVYLDVTVAGRQFEYEFDPDPDQSFTFEWDGLDAYGRELIGEQPVKVVTGYAYEGQYERPLALSSAFGAAGSGSGGGGGGIGFVTAREEVVLTTEWRGFIGGRFIGGSDARARSFGGWSLDVHHAYDPVGGRLYLGDGQTRSASGIGQIIETVAGDGSQTSFEDVTIAPDGRVVFLESGLVRRIETDGSISTLAGAGPLSPDSVPADSASLTHPFALAYGPDRSLWIVGNYTGDINLLYRIWPDGIIDTYGTGQGYAGDGGPVWADSVRFNKITDVAVGADGSVYVLHRSDSGIECIGASCRRVRRIAPDGTLSTIAGNGAEGTYGNGGPAIDAAFDAPSSLTVGPDGSVYVGDTDEIRRITPDGSIHRFAGLGGGGWGAGYSGDGGPALSAEIFVAKESMSFGPDGSLYFSQVEIGGNGHVVRKIDPTGIISTVAGSGPSGYSGDGGRPLAALFWVPDGTAVDPQGNLYVVDRNNRRIRRIGSSLPGFTAGEHLIPSSDQSLLYRFSSAGQHLETLWARTGATLYTFEYDADNRLSSVIDADSLVTTIQRAQDGTPQSITGPYGQVTTLGVDARGYLSAVTNPASETYAFVTDSTGLLTRFITPTQDTTVIGYDTDGRVVQHTDPSGRVRTWSRVEGGDSVVVTMSTPAGTTAYLMRETVLGGLERRVTGPTGQAATTVEDAAGVLTSTTPDSVATTAVLMPRVTGLEKGIPGDSIVVAQPSGLTGVRYLSRAVTVTDSSGFELIGAVSDTVRVNARTSTATWSRSTNRLVTTSAEGRETTTAFDELGRVTTSVLPGIDSTIITRDALGRVKASGIGDTSTMRSAGSPSRPIRSAER
jgi:YD repeat-containing protein